jgi:glycosyltransferase involved in cell wall biosynthesis
VTRFSIVIPVFDEAAFLPVGLPRMVEELETAGLDYRILVMDNGSRDGTADIARRVADDLPSPDRIEVHSLPDPDYGAAMRDGFIRAEGDWVVNFDIDYFSAGFLGKVQTLAADADLVIASKRDRESEDRRPPLRRLATGVFNLLLRSLFASEVSDTHGMKAFRRELVADVVPDVQSRQDLFDTELVLRAERRGYRIGRSR